MVDDHFATFHGQHTFWGGEERKEAGGEKLSSELFRVVYANTRKPII